MILLAQGRFWRAALPRGGDAVELEVLKGALPEALAELRELRILVPLARWNLLVKNARCDRKLLGGVLLEFAKSKDRVGAAVANDRLFAELQRVVLDATVSLVENGSLTLDVPKENGGSA